jgi:hypothetical protein
MQTERLSTTIYGLPGSIEHQAAESIRDIIRSAVLAEDCGTIAIHTDVYIAAQKREQIDILLHAHFPHGLTRRLRLPYASEQTDVYFSDVISVIEVKAHSRDKVNLTGTNARVLYRDGWKSASSQSHDQIYSVKQFLRERLGWTPYVCNLIFFPNLLRSDLPPTPNNYLAANLTFQDFLEKLCTARKLTAPSAHCRTATFSCTPTQNRARISECMKRLQESLGGQQQYQLLNEPTSPAKPWTIPTYPRRKFSLLGLLRVRRGNSSSLLRSFSSFIAGLVCLLLLIALLARLL